MLSETGRSPPTQIRKGSRSSPFATGNAVKLDGSRSPQWRIMPKIAVLQLYIYFERI